MPSGTPIDWSLYDDLLINTLPNMTIKEWVNINTPHISTKAVGARAKKLGIQPKNRNVSEEHKLKISNSLRKELSQEQINFIVTNANILSRKDISRKLGISLYCVNKCLDDNNIKIDEDFQKKIHASKSRMHVSKATSAYKEKLKNNAEFKRKISQSISIRSKKLWKNNKYRAKIVNGINEAYNKTNLRIRLSTISKNRYLTDKRVRDILHSERDFKNSKLNDSVASVLDGYNIQYEREFKLANYRIDFKIGDVLLEVQGDYWHNLPQNKRNDRAKASIIRKYYPQYDLKYLWESEFKSIRGVDRLLEVIGHKKPEPTNILLSELKFEEISKCNSIEKFLNSYHYRGWVSRGSLYFRYQYENQTIILAVFGPPVRPNTASGNVLELIRLCRNPFFSNRNMGSSFLSKCIKHIKSIGIYDNLVSFSEDRLHDGAVYKATNWQLVGKTQSDYEYLSADNIPIHKKTLYNKAKAAGMTEREYAEENGYRKSYVGTKTKFIYKLK